MHLVPVILFEDTHLIVISKPAGLLSQSDISETPSLVDWAREHFGRHYVGLIHRLDRNTTGAMVIAKRSKSADRLSAALRDGTLTRGYLAGLCGVLSPGIETPFRWTHYLTKNPATNHVTSHTQPTEGAQRAVLTGRVLLRQADRSWVEIELETGRSHQIRAQAQAEGHPLVGDKKYGATLDAPRPALHSWWIRFPHPMTHEVLTFLAPVPEDLLNLGARGLILSDNRSDLKTQSKA